MKTNFKLKNGLGGQLRSAGAALFLLSGFAALGQPFASPVGTTWDCVMSGPREGLAYITFTSTPFTNEAFPSGGNFSFTGTEILVPKPKKNEVLEGRNIGGDASRTGAFSANTNGLGTQIYGSEDVSGPWNFDSKGRMVGYFFEISTPVCTTNAFAVSTNGVPIVTDPNAFCVATNVSGGSNLVDLVCFTNQLVCNALTNAISFVGKVVSGKRLTLVSSTPFGNVTLRGVPAVPLPDISGSWFGIARHDGQTFNEFFTLSGGPNIYNVLGAGPGYGYTNAIAMVSSQKKIGFAATFEPATASALVRAVVGPFNSRKVSGITHGIQGSGAFGSFSPVTGVRFDVVRQPPLD